MWVEYIDYQLKLSSFGYKYRSPALYIQIYAYVGFNCGIIRRWLDMLIFATSALKLPVQPHHNLLLSHCSVIQFILKYSLNAAEILFFLCLLRIAVLFLCFDCLRIVWIIRVFIPAVVFSIIMADRLGANAWRGDYKQGAY